MSIAGTPFVLGDIGEALGRLGERARRCRSGDAAIAYAVERCQEDRAVCLVCPDGAVVLTLAPHDDGRITAIVLLAVSTGAMNAFARYEESMLAIARDLEANFLAFKTDRSGWERLLSSQWRRCGPDTYSRST